MDQSEKVCIGLRCKDHIHYWAKTLVWMGCLAYLSHLWDIRAKFPSLKSILVVSKIQDIFPMNVHCMPPHRDIELYLM